MNRLRKVAFSRTIKEVTWENSTLFHGDLIQEVQNLKQGDGAGILISGSGTTVQQLSNGGLIDEYVLTVTLAHFRNRDNINKEGRIPAIRSSASW